MDGRSVRASGPVSIRAFSEQPLGRWVESEHGLFWYPNRMLRVLRCWGIPTIADTDRLIDCLRVQMGRKYRHASFVDVRNLERVDGEVFQTFLQFVMDRCTVYSESVSRSAIIHGDDAPASLIAGYTRLIGTPFEVRMFREPIEALAWLGHRPDAEAIVRECDGIRDEIVTRQPIVARIRDCILEAPSLKLEAAATRLGVGARQIQRSLSEIGTTFRRERRALRVEMAKRLLRDTDLKVLAVAMEVGYQTAGNFSRVFQQETGSSPSGYRQICRSG